MQQIEIRMPEELMTDLLGKLPKPITEADEYVKAGGSMGSRKVESNRAGG